MIGPPAHRHRWSGPTDTYTFDAFGSLIAQTFTGASPTPNRYLYAGEQFEARLKGIVASAQR